MNESKEFKISEKLQMMVLRLFEHEGHDGFNNRAFSSYSSSSPIPLSNYMCLRISYDEFVHLESYMALFR